MSTDYNNNKRYTNIERRQLLSSLIYTSAVSVWLEGKISE